MRSPPPARATLPRARPRALVRRVLPRDRRSLRECRPGCVGFSAPAGSARTRRRHSRWGGISSRGELFTDDSEFPPDIFWKNGEIMLCRGR